MRRLLAESNEAREEDKEEKMDLREKILSTEDIKTEVITVKGWGNVKIKCVSLNVKERGKVREAARTKVNPDGTVVLDVDLLEVGALIAGAKDPETGKEIFRKEDVETLLKKNANFVDEVALKVMELSGMTPEAGALRRRRFQGR